LLPRWLDQCGALRDGAAPHSSDIAILLQMIVGAWPLDLDGADQAGRSAFARRLAQWQEKALREAKLQTDWTLPNEPYERAARDLLDALLVRNEASLLADISRFVESIAPAGAVNGLAQTLLKLTLPGVPDIYQGTEFWDFSLVDPDNRRPVDFTARATALSEAPLEDLASTWRDGRIKQAVIARVLALRATRPKLFADGSYQPLEVRGACADRIVAFARRFENELAVTVAPRVASNLLRDGEILFASHAWRDTFVALPDSAILDDVFTGQRMAGGLCAVHSLLGRLPVALLA
jgi:maltooligosyltrehalose synthase